MKTTHRITIDLIRKDVSQVAYAMQNDANSRVIEITLLENGVAWTPPAETSFALSYAKPDGTKGFYGTLPDGSNAISSDGNIVSATLAPQVLTVAGVANAALVIRNPDGNRISSFPFEIHVIADPSAGATDSEDYFNITEFLTRDGWIPDMYLGTDAQGRVVEVPVPVQEVDATLTREGIAADAKATGDALKALPIGQGEDGYTWISGLRRASAIGLTREEGGITVTTTLEGGMTEVSRLVLDEGGYPVAIETDGAICGLTWAGFAEAELQIWEGGSY